MANKKLEIVAASDILSYEDSKTLYGGITPWEGRFLIGNPRERQLKKLVKPNVHLHELAIQYTICRLITKLIN